MKLARTILYNHQRRKHPRDSNDSPVEGIHDMSDGVINKTALMDHEEDVPDPADEDPENVPDSNSTGDSKVTPAWRLMVTKSG